MLSVRQRTDAASTSAEKRDQVTGLPSCISDSRTPNCADAHTFEVTEHFRRRIAKDLPLLQQGSVALAQLALRACLRHYFRREKKKAPCGNVCRAKITGRGGAYGGIAHV
jgi:hypothetical protein